MKETNQNRRKLKRFFAYAIMGLFLIPLVAFASPSVLPIAAMADQGLGAMAMPMPMAGEVPHYFGPYPNYATSDLPMVTYDASGNITSVMGGIRKFVDSLPGLGEANANNLGQYMPIAVADKVTYPGSDYYHIALVQFEEQMHSDLQPTKLRGYVQLETPVNSAVSKHIPLMHTDGTPVLMPDGSQAIAVDDPHYLGPFIIARKDVPVRVNFTNLLPTGMGGDLFLPVDTTVMGAGMGPEVMLNPDGTPMYNPDGTLMMASYSQNRGTLHLHGGRTPWISDGTPHQWITPADEMTAYPKGVSVYNVPDMPDPGPGSMTFFYTNQQSARLMFYHDHTYGLTRLNVYAGEAAGYLLQDDVELALISAGIIPSVQIPLVIQDKTFVPDDMMPISNMWGNFSSQLAFQDPTWNTTKWGTPGDLWYPHVYMPMANPSDPSGMSMFGRWMYSPWFWPPQIPEFGPVPNPYYNASNPDMMMEPPMIPGVPNISEVGEAFMDTPVINGAAYPYLEVDPTAYRFRVLNAADDRFFNLQLYVADPSVTTFDGRTDTEVKMVPAVPTLGYPEGWPTDGREGGVPDPATAGPEMIQIANEGGFLPAPVVLPNQPVDWNWDMGTFDMGILAKYTLLLGCAERADVIIDFSQFAGKTLILYNDCPAPSPASDPRQDYYTGHPDFTDSGGSQTTIPGFGSNTRTLMQIRVANITPAPAFDLARLRDAFNSTAAHTSVFQDSQHEIIVPQHYYNSAYNATFPVTWANIFTNSLTFTPIGSTTPVTLPFEAKAIQDEMGEAFDHKYGRMAVQFGLQVTTTLPQAQTLVLYGFASPPTEVQLAPDVYGTQIGVVNDGTQIWKIVHNGVDVHPVHWHMFEVQVMNRVAWDNNIREPDPNELGWKETLRVNPLQNTIVALRPILPNVPFEIPNSIRMLDPTMPAGTVLETRAFSPNAQPITVVNHEVNFGWEYVWHCHILAHEENDMMRTMAFAVPPLAPNNLLASVQGKKVTLTWTDNSLSETGFVIERANDPGFATNRVLFQVGTGVTVYVDNTIDNKQSYFYRVRAINVVGDTWDYATVNNPAVTNFPTITVSSEYSNIIGGPLGTTILVSLTQAAATGSPVVLNWTYAPGGDQTGFLIERATDALFTQGLTSFNVAGNVFTFSNNNAKSGTVYYYRVAATNALGTGAYSNVMSITPHK
jgi:FtsP/CotA-like multicopper oxidase with cupredoxin domain